MTLKIADDGCIIPNMRQTQYIVTVQQVCQHTKVIQAEIRLWATSKTAALIYVSRLNIPLTSVTDVREASH